MKKLITSLIIGALALSSFSSMAHYYGGKYHKHNNRGVVIIKDNSPNLLGVVAGVAATAIIVDAVTDKKAAPAEPQSGAVIIETKMIKQGLMDAITVDGKVYILKGTG
jgi:hypothetical protein